MNLEYGKRYVRRDGGVTGPLTRCHSSLIYPFADAVTTFTPEGKRYDWNEPDKFDIVAEYVESDSRHTLDMCDALNTRIDQCDSTPEAKRLVLLAEMLEYCLAIHETAAVEVTKEQAKETGIAIASRIIQRTRENCMLLSH